MKWLKAGLAFTAVALIGLYLMLKLLFALLVQGFWLLVAAGAVVLAVRVWRRYRSGQSNGAGTEARGDAEAPAPVLESDPKSAHVAVGTGLDRDLPTRSQLPLLAHKDRSYVAVGREHGFTAARSDAYLRLDDVSATRPFPATGDHSALVARYSARRRAERTRSTRP